MGFVHLHLHSEYSLLDGCCRIKDIVDCAQKMNNKAVAITDHGVMYGAVDFYKECKKHGIKPIIGCEVYISPRNMEDKTYEHDSEYFHLILLVKNETGYKNLIKLVSKSFTEGFYYKPRIDLKTLKKYSEGLIALSGCIAGEIPQLIIKGNLVGAKEKVLEYKNIFNDDFYLEVQAHGLKEEKTVKQVLVHLSRDLGVSLVATNDVHYINKTDAKYQDVLMCVEMHKTIDDTDRLRLETNEFYYKSEEEMREIFADMPEAVDNTLVIAEKCNFEFDFNTYHLPKYKLPHGTEPYEFIKKLCLKGINERYVEVTQELLKRLDSELETIKNMGFIDYFLIVWDFVSFARKKGIPVGPGRGSAAGSLVSYVLYITDIDPIKYDLIFERFLNPERITMPDIDIDFCYERRKEVIDYVVNKYGASHVAQVVTFGTMGAKAAIKDVGRVLNMPYSDVDAVSKQIPRVFDITIAQALEKNEALKDMYNENEQVKELLDTAMAIEGMPRHTSVHAAAVVITETPISDYLPVLKTDEFLITQYDKKKVEELGLLKMDFLALRTLTVIQYVIDLVREFRGKEIDFNKIGYCDKETYMLISSGNTDGVFQLESTGMKSFLRDFKPENLEDIIAAISLYRPGPMDQIGKYVENKRHPENIKYKHPMLEEILSVTYGCIVYQEQVMQIVRNLAGFSYGRADTVRRAMAKKDMQAMEKAYDEFIYGITENGKVIVPGAVRMGISEETSKSIFNEILSFAKYAFNKSHAAAYAVNAYQTAYLKAHYKTEFMAALMTSFLDNTDKIVQYIDECNKLGIKVNPPDINKGYATFTPDDNSINFGLAAVKNVGRHLIDDVVRERKSKGNFKNFADFCQRMAGADLNKRAVESLIKCGAFDNISLSRTKLAITYELIMDEILNQNKNNILGQINLFDDDSEINSIEQKIADITKNSSEFTLKEKLAMEKETTGIFISGHPLDAYRNSLEGCVSVNKLRCSARENDGEYKDNDFVRLGGIITKMLNKTTKRNEKMAFVTLETLNGSIEIIVFPNALEQYKNLIYDDSPVFVTGRLSLRDDEEPKVILSSLSKLVKQNSPGLALYLKVDNKNLHKLNDIKKSLRFFGGKIPVYLYNPDTNTTSKANKSLYVNGSPGLISELSRLLGNDCVKLIGNTGDK